MTVNRNLSKISRCYVKAMDRELSLLRTQLARNFVNLLTYISVCEHGGINENAKFFQCNGSHQSPQRVAASLLRTVKREPKR